MIKRTIRKLWRVSPALLIVSLFINTLALTAPLYMIQLYNRVLSSMQVETLILITAMAAVALAVYGALEALRGAMLNRMGEWVETAASAPVIRGSLEAMLAQEPLGAQPVRDLESVQSFVMTHLKTLLDLPFAPIFFLAAFVLHPWLGYLTLVSAIVLFTFAVLNDTLTRANAERYASASVNSQMVLENSLRSAEAMRAMGMENAVIDRWRRAQEVALGEQMRSADISSTFTGLSRFVRMLAQVGILGLGAYLVILGELSVGLLIAGSIILGRALAPIEQFLTAWRSMSETRIAYRRLVDLDDHLPMPRQSPAVKVTGELEVQNVAYRPYSNAELILRNVRCSIEPGEAMLVLGPSGAGKSTLARLIVGAQTPTSGRILLDGTDFKQWDSADLGPRIGYLPQTVELFPGTIAENIARMADPPDMAKVIEAAKNAGAHDVISHFPQGYETPIGPGGGFLSGGQRQRVGLARALYGKPRLIVLDEPNANLDTDGEADLIEAVKRAKAWGAAIAIISHTPPLLRVADTVLIIQNGEATVFGPASDIVPKLMNVRSDAAAVTESSKIDPRESAG